MIPKIWDVFWFMEECVYSINPAQKLYLVTENTLIGVSQKLVVLAVSSSVFDVETRDKALTCPTFILGWN